MTTRCRSSSTLSTGRHSSRPGSWPVNSGNPQRRDRRHPGQRAVSRRTPHAQAHRRRKWLTAKAVFGLWPANSVGDDVVVLTEPAESGVRNRESPSDAPRSTIPDSPFPIPCIFAPASRQTVDRPDFCLADFIAPKAAANGTGSVHSRSLQASASTRMWPVSKPRTTTTTPSCSRRWPTVWPKHWPSACINACVPNSGPMSTTKHSTTKP